MIAQREAHRAQGGSGGGGGGGGPPGGMGGGMGGGGMGMGPGPGAPPMVNIPPSLLNNPNIPNEIIHGLQAGKIGSTVFVANVSCKYAFSCRTNTFTGFHYDLFHKSLCILY